MTSILLLFGFLSLILLLANRADVERRREEGSSLAKLLAYGLIVLIQLCVFIAGIGAQLFGVLLRGETGGEILNNPAIADIGVNLDSIDFNIVGAGLWVPALLGLLVLLPPVRRLLSNILSIDKASHVHAIALSMTTMILPNLFVFLGVGLENVTGALAAGAGENAASQLITTTWAQNLGFFVMGLIGVGWLTHRSLGESFARLKLTRLSFKELVIGFGFGLLALVVLGVFTAAADAMGLGDPVVDALSEELYGPFFESFIGIMTVGLAAAWGEETVFRGALQPKFGRIFTSLIFAIVHGNYGLSMVTLAIFGVGYLLGYIRDRYSTTTSMVTHATFNSVQALIAWLAFTYGLGV